MEQLVKFTARGLPWTAWGRGSGNAAASDDAETEEEIVEQNLLYGIPADDYRIEHGEIAPGETMGRILNRYGVGAATVDRLDRAAKTDFPLDGIRAGMAAGKLTLTDTAAGKAYSVVCSLTERQQAILLAGGLLNYTKEHAL